MEPKSLKRKEKPTASSSPLQRIEQLTSHDLMKNEAISAGVLNDHHIPNQFSSSDMNHMADISHSNGSPNTNIDLRSCTNELPQQHCHDQMLTKNMNDSHLEGLPQNSVQVRTTDGLHMIRHGGVGNRRNLIAKPRLRQAPSDLAAFQAYFNEENYGSTNPTFDAFQPIYGEQFGSFLTLGGKSDINDRRETINSFERGVTIGSGSAAIETNTCFQTANGTSMSSINPPIRIPSNAIVGISPYSSLQQTQLGYQYHPSYHSDMASLLGGHSSQWASLQQNQGLGSGYNQFRAFDSQGILRKNLSMTDLNRHKTQQAFEQQCNGALLIGSSSAEPSWIRHHHSGAVVDQSSQHFHGSCLGRGNIQTTIAAYRAQPRLRMLQSPSQQSNFASAINPLRPISGQGPHCSAVPQLPWQPVPASPGPAHVSVRTLSRRAQPALPDRSFPSSAPKNVHNPSSSQLNTTDHIKRKDSNEIQLLGYNCFLCKRDLSFEPKGPILKPKNRPKVAVLPCGHAFHNECLDRITPPELLRKSPPCIPCAMSNCQL